MCVYPEDSFEPLCLPDEGLIALYVAGQEDVPVTDRLHVERNEVGTGTQ
jgi:hypothetical protein